MAHLPLFKKKKNQKQAKCYASCSFWLKQQQLRDHSFSKEDDIIKTQLCKSFIKKQSWVLSVSLIVGVPGLSRVIVGFDSLQLFTERHEDQRRAEGPTAAAFY